MNNFELKYNEYLNIINKGLSQVIESLKDDVPKDFLEAIAYSVIDGGKRVRPVLMLSVADFLNLPLQKVINYALAIELIHSYSLVHDDLPAMDNDDYRRGKLSTHKKYGEDIGILVGDALLNLAIEVCLDVCGSLDEDKKAQKCLFSLSGAKGMVKGQFLDLTSTNKDDDKLLEEIHDNKTAKLLIAPLIIPSILSGDKYYNELLALGRDIGLMFQIKDDILDVEGSVESLGKTPNKDDKSGKLTFVSIYGLSGAKDKLKIIYQRAKANIISLGANDFLLDFIDFIFERKK